MGWTTPKTWAVGTANKATASDFNTHIRDNLNWLYRTQARKTANESVTSSTALQDDDHLTLSIAANENWLYEFFLPCNGATAGDFKFAIAVPAGASGVWGGIGPGVATATNIQAVAASAFGDANPLSFGGTGADSVIRLQATVLNGGTAGNVNLRWAQDTSSGTASIIYAGAYQMGHRISG